MTTSGILLILVFIGVIVALTAPLGAYMTKVFAGDLVDEAFSDGSVASTEQGSLLVQ